MIASVSILLLGSVSMTESISDTVCIHTHIMQKVSILPNGIVLLMETLFFLLATFFLMNWMKFLFHRWSECCQYFQKNNPDCMII